MTRSRVHELPRVLELKSDMEDVRRHAREEVVRLEGEVEKEREAHGYLHELVSTDG